MGLLLLPESCDIRLAMTKCVCRRRRSIFRLPSRFSSFCATILLLVSCTSPRERVDSGLAAEIDSIKAIDNHAHPMRVTNEGEKDSEYDALPVEAMEPYDTV